jgi:hypothetical protein
MYPSRESTIKRGAWRKYSVMRRSKIMHFWEPVTFVSVTFVGRDTYTGSYLRSRCGLTAIQGSQALVIDRKAPRCKKCQNKK